MPLVSDLCDEIVSLNSALGLDLKGQLQPGATSDAIDSFEAELPIVFPSSLRELYQWSEGLKDDAAVGCEMFPWYGFESLKVSSEMFHVLSGAKDFPRFREADNKWRFPVFHGGGTDFYCMRCQSEVSADGVIVDDMSDADPFPAFISLEAMLLTIRDAYRLGVYYLGADGRLSCGVDTYHTSGPLEGQLKSVDIGDFKAIARKYNPGIACWTK